MKTIKTCPCGSTISVIPSQINRKKYCSRECQCKYRINKNKGMKYVIKKINPTSFKKGMIPHNKGKPSLLITNNPGCAAIHDWVKRWKKDPKKCEMCGVVGKLLDWSSKSSKRLRDLDDWQRLCRKCHCAYDFEHFGVRKNMYSKGKMTEEQKEKLRGKRGPQKNPRKKDIKCEI